MSQVYCYQNKLGPRFDPATGEDLRKRDRARTYQGIADAMAAQWSKAVEGEWELTA